MSSFKLPVSLCKQIQSIMTRFFWDDKQGTQKISWIAWDKLTNPKSVGGLGFRDVAAFNDALLAKLGWRLITHPDSLFARVILGKYSHHYSFMEAPLSSNPSHGWRSIIAGREVLKQGLGWRVGNGEQIQVWEDPWLSLASPECPIGPAPPEFAQLNVSDFITEHNQWDWELIRRVITQYENHIRLLHLGSRKREDRLIWLPVKNGNYTSKSGYGLLTASAAPPDPDNFNWATSIWKVKTCPKIKTLLWKTAAGALPVGSRLESRGIQLDTSCKRCQERETHEHVFIDCPFDASVWKEAPLNIPPLTSLSSVKELIAKGNRLHGPTSTEGAINPFPWILWHIWTARNNLIFNNRGFSPEEIISKASSDAIEWEIAQRHLVKKNQERVTEREAEPPDPGIATCFVDAAWNKDTLSCGMGWIFRLPNQNETSQGSAAEKWTASALVAEAKAVHAALLDATRKGIQELHVFSDSQTLIRAISIEPITEIFAIVKDIQELSTSFLSISFSFVPRTKNVDADLIAKQALSGLLVTAT